MPKYKFKCKNCNNVDEKFLSIELFKEIKENKCSNCFSLDVARVFGNTYSNIDKDIHDIKLDIKEEIRATINKVKSGDISATDDLCGSEINTLKR